MMTIITVKVSNSPAFCFTSVGEIWVWVNIKTIITGVIIGVAISPVFCFTSVGEIRVWIALRWQRLLSVATL